MKSITFTVQIQADFHDRDSRKTIIAQSLCDEINRILLRHDGMVSGAQIIPAPKNIKIRKTS